MKPTSSRPPRRPLQAGLWLTLLLVAAALALHLRQMLDFSRAGFDALFTAGLGFLELAGFLALVWRGRVMEPARDRDRPALGAWLAGLAAVLLFSVTVNFIVDPYSRFGERPFPRLVVPMLPKVEAYQQRTEPPQLIILGSSRALPVSPAYIQSKLGISAFNMAVQGDSTENILILTRFMLHQGKLPEVLFVEVAPPLDPGEGAVAERTPPTLFRYMPADSLFMTLQQDGSFLFNIHSLADASFLVIRRAWLGMPADEVRFDSSGLITNMATGTDRASLEKALETIGVPRCSQVDPAGVENIQELIDIVTRQGSAIVFYQSPRHPLLRARLLADPDYVTCQQAFEERMGAFAAANPNVFFLQYFQLDTVDRLDLNGFYDPQHITYLGADAMVDTALPTLQQALDWAAAHRSQP